MANADAGCPPGDRGTIRRVMDFLPLAEGGSEDASELQTLFPDVVSLKQRAQRLNSLSVFLGEVELSPHMQRLLAAERGGGLGRFRAAAEAS